MDVLGSEIKCCRFHLGQAWHRKIVGLHLGDEYKESESERGQRLHWVFALRQVSKAQKLRAAVHLRPLRPLDPSDITLKDYMTAIGYKFGAIVSFQLFYSQSLWVCCEILNMSQINNL